MSGVDDILSAFSEVTRLRMALILDHSSLCVGCIVTVLDMPQPTVSRHLSMLRRGGIVEKKKDGLHAYYTLMKDAVAFPLVKGLLRAYGGYVRCAEPFRGDMERLRRLAGACALDCNVKIKPRRNRHEEVY